jgi:general secretion pathway protein L
MLNSTFDPRIIKRFFRWWKQELSFLIPNFIARLFKDPLNLIIIHIHEGKIQFDYTQNKTPKNLVLMFDEHGRLEYKKFLLGNPWLQKADIIFRLHKKKGLLKILTLPKAVEDNLTQVILYELDRYTPFNSQQVYYSVTPLETTIDKITVRLILTPKTTLDNIYEGLIDWGIKPLRVDYAGAIIHSSQTADQYNLLPEEKRYRKNKFLIWLQALFIMLFFGLLITTMVLPVWFYHQSERALYAEIKRIKKEAIEVQDIQNKMAILSEKTNWLIHQKQKVPPLIEIINTVSQRLNNDTWLKIIEYKNEKLHLTGESKDAAKLINILETSSLFSEADFESTVTKNKQTGFERFRIIVSVNANEDYEE